MPGRFFVFARPTFGPPPEMQGLKARAVRMPTQKGLHLFGWYAAAVDPGICPVAVLLHGWGGNLLPAALGLQAASYGVLLVEASNHGRNDHDGHSPLPQFAQGMDSAIDWLAAQPGVDAGTVVTLSHTLGAPAALLSA